MGLLLSRSHFHGANNSPKSTFYTDQLLKSNFPLIIIGATDLNVQKPLFPCHRAQTYRTFFFFRFATIHDF